MAIKAPLYRFRDGITPLNAAELNRRFFDLDGRMDPLEQKSLEYDDAIRDLEELGLRRIEEVLLPALERIRRLESLGFLVAPLSPDDTFVFEEGEATVFVSNGMNNEGYRDLFVPSPFVIITRDFEPDSYAVGRTISYDDQTGALTINVISVGSGSVTEPVSDVWVSSVAGSTLAQIEMLAQTIEARDSSVAIGESATASATAADTSRAQAQTARNAAQTARTGSEQALAAVLRIIASSEVPPPATPVLGQFRYFPEAGEVRVWNGSGWVTTVSYALNGLRDLSGTFAAGASGVVALEGGAAFEMVYLNGMLLRPGDDYTKGPDSVTFLDFATGDEWRVWAYTNNGITGAELTAATTAASASADRAEDAADRAEILIAAQPLLIETFGDPSLAATWTAALAESGQTGRAVKGLLDTYTITGTIIGNHFAAFDFDNITTLRRAAPGAPLFLTVGFNSFADGVRRGYSWHSSIAARNAAGRALGDYVMVAPAQNDFFDATWWECIATPSNVNGAWRQVEPVTGQVGGLYRNVRFDGGDSAGATDLVCGIYGVDTILHQFRAEGGGISLHTESPGSLFSSQVNRNLMWSINDIEVRNASALCWHANHQSDGSIYGTVAFLRDTVVGTILRIGTKASGTKWLGGHTWGGLVGSDIVIDGASNTMVGFEHERPVKVQAGGFQFFGQAYRINNASREDGAAFVISPNLYDIKIQGKIAHFRHPIQILAGTPLVGSDINLTYYSEDGSAAPISPAGQGAAGIAGTSNRARIVRTGAGGGLNLHTDDSRRRPAYLRQVVEVSYASAITLNSDTAQVFRIGQLTGNPTVSISGTPQNGDTIEILFTQDATGGRSVAWGSGISGGFTDTGSGFWRRSITFTWHGAVWLRSGGTGAWLA